MGEALQGKGGRAWGCRDRGKGVRGQMVGGECFRVIIVAIMHDYSRIALTKLTCLKRIKKCVSMHP